jgi:tetratricopeptide (TPR) repeat protein
LGQRGSPASSPSKLKPSASSNHHQTGWRGYPVLGFVGIFFAGLVAYWPALHGTLLWDDNAHITSPALQSFHGLWRIWFELGATQQYYPLLHTAFWIEHRLWGDAVVGYHLANLFEHCLSACLVVLFARLLKLRGAWLAGFIFALHPVCVEAVAWMSEQKSTLSGVFYLAAALTYLHFDRSRKRSLYLVALGLFVLALLSKSVTATLPAALLVVFWWERGKINWKRDALPLAPWFVIGASAGLFTAWVERNYIGAQGAGYELTLGQHILLAGRIACFYAGKILWPADFMFSYPRWDVDPHVWWQWIYPVVVIVVAVGLIVVARKLRGPLASFLYFLGTLFPVLGFMHVFPFKFSYVADHFQYLASLGVIVPAAWLIASGVARLSSSEIGLPVIGALLALALGALTWQQSGLYTDAETLYRATLQRNPGSWMTHNNLAGALAQMPGRLPEAIEEYRAALQLKPDYAIAHDSLGGLLMQEGRLPEAMEEFQAALRAQPNFALAHNNLGIVLAQTPGRLPDAIREFEATIRIDPKYAKAHMNLGNAYLQMPGRLVDAIAEYETTIRLDPDYAQPHINLGLAFMQMPGKLADAVTQLETALRLQSDNANARMYLGDALAQIPERRQDAIAQYEIVLQQQPDFVAAQEALARLRGQDAVPQGQKP